MRLDYKPPPTVAKFLRSNARMRVIMGPQGSGKSSGSVIETLRRSTMQQKDGDGIRRSRWVIVRNTMPMLKDTTIPTFLDWFPSGTVGKWHQTDKFYHFQFNDVDAQVLFRALDDRDDIAKLLSSEYTGCYFNEFREIDPAIYEAMTRRIGRYPSKKNGPGPSWYGIWADTNPPQVGSWHQKMFEKELENNWEVFKQPSGRSAEAENAENLPDDYYDANGLTPEYVRVMIDGEYGHDMAGLPVYGNAFRKDFHVAKENLRARRGEGALLHIGLDAGLTPAAVMAQQDYRSRVSVLGNCYVPKGQTMGMEKFMTERLMPYLRERFPNMAYRGVIDPTAAQRSQANEAAPIDVVRRFFPCYQASTNRFERRVNAVETLFMRSIDGGPAVLIDPREHFLIESLGWGYRFKRMRDGESNTNTEPEKNIWSHTAEAFGYLCVMLVGASGIEARTRRREVSVASARGWT